MGEKNYEKMLEVRRTREEYMLGGGEEKIEKYQHAKGRLSARERVDYLFDEGTFVEYGLFARPASNEFDLQKSKSPGDGLIIGYGKVNGKQVFACSQDFTILGGSMGETHGLKMIRAIEEAARNHAPIVYLWDSGGGRIQESKINSVMKVFALNSIYSGYIPQISALMGVCAGGSAYSPMLSDVVFAVNNESKFYICGPSVIKFATGEDVDEESLSGAWTNNSVSGNCHRLAENDEDCIDQIKQYLSYMPQYCDGELPEYSCDQDRDELIEELDHIVPDEDNKAYNMWDIINLIVDKDSAFEISPYWAKNIITTLARLDGRPVGIVANQPKVVAGCLDINSSDKMARFINICDAYGIALIYLVDTPGYLPGTNQEHGGIIRHGAKGIFATATATVPKIQVVVRKVIGGTTISMGGNRMNMDANYLWPTFSFGIFDPKTACNIILKSKIKAAATAEEAEEILKQGIDEFVDARTWKSIAGHFIDDDVIEPNQTRKCLIQTLDMLRNKDRTMVPIQHPKKWNSIKPE